MKKRRIDRLFVENLFRNRRKNESGQMLLEEMYVSKFI